MAGPGDETAAGAAGRGPMRASQADREQVIEVLKDAFAQGRLTEDELDMRAGQAFTSRTYAELAALTADIPAGPAPAPPRQPARAQNRAPASPTAPSAAIGLGFAVTAVGFLATTMAGLLEQSMPLLLLAVFFLIVALPCVTVAASRQQRRSRGQPPPRRGQGGRAAEGRRPGQADYNPALPPDHPDQTRADLRTHRSRPGRPRSSGQDARAPRGMRPVPDAVLQAIFALISVQSGVCRFGNLAPVPSPPPARAGRRMVPGTAGTGRPSLAGPGRIPATTPPSTRCSCPPPGRGRPDPGRQKIDKQADGGVDRGLTPA